MRSPIPWLVVLVVIGLILLAALTFPAPGMAAITGKYTPTAAPRAVDHPFGVEFMGGITQAATSPDIQAIHDVGASWVRVAIYWARLQPREDSTIDWTSVDAGFRRLARLGLHPIVVIRDIPSWAAMEHPTLHDRPSCGPVRSDKMDAYLDFVATLVRRYSGPPFNVKYWEIYNEPDKIYSVRPDIDIGGCFGDIWYDEYVRILRDVYRTVKEIDPQAVIAFGGVAHDWFYYPGTPYPHSGLFDPYFLDEVIDKRRGGDWFDVMNFHTYYAWRWYWEYYGYGKDVLAKYNYMREQLRQYGYPDKPIIITETGMRSYDANHPELVSERTQARYVLRLFARILTVMYDQPFVWFSIRDIGHSHGLLREDGSEKPSYRVYRFGVPQFTGARFLGMTGDYGNTIEGYRYEKEGHEFWVLWYKDGPSYTYRNISIPWTRVRVTDMFGEEQRVIVDGGTGDLDGQVNGRITLPIPHDPVYLDSPDGPIGWPTPTPTPTSTPTPTATPTPSPTPTPRPLPRHMYMPWIARWGGATSSETYMPWVARGESAVPLSKRMTSGRVPGRARLRGQAPATPTPWPTPTPTLTTLKGRITVYRPGVWHIWGTYMGVAALFGISLVTFVAITYVTERRE